MFGDMNPRPAMLGGRIRRGIDLRKGRVISLLHFDGPDGGTGIFDETGKIWTRFGPSPSLISTAQSKFGGSSLLVNVPNSTTNSGVDTAYQNDFLFGTDEFTIEWFQYWRSISTPPYQAALDHGYNSAGGITVVTGSMNGRYTIQLGATAVCTEATAPTTGAWVHYAICRKNSTFTIWRGGALSAAGVSSAHVGVPGRRFAVGSYASDSGATGQVFNGWFDEFQVTNGEALYTKPFTPPNAPFSIV